MDSTNSPITPFDYLNAATTLRDVITHSPIGADPDEFRCLRCGAPVEDRFFCQSCQTSALPPDDGYVPRK